jgi:hypothetical protein
MKFQLLFDLSLSKGDVCFDKALLSEAEGLSIYALWVRTVQTLKG